MFTCMRVCLHVCIYAYIDTRINFQWIAVAVILHVFRSGFNERFTTDLKLRPFLAQLLPEPGRLADESHGSGRS